jgi:uncharacterized protein YabE (DUF348 family)
MLPVSTFLVVIFLGMALYVSLGGQTVTATDKHVVQVFYDNKKQTVPTRAKTVGDLLQRLDIQIGDKDVVEPTRDTPIVEDNFMVNVYRSRLITIIDGATHTVTTSAAFSDRLVLSQAGIKTYPEDRITRAPVENFLSDGIGEKITVERATPVHLNLYGTDLLVRTHTRTVKELLAEKNIVVAKDDTLSADPSTVLTPNTQIFITRQGTQIVTEDHVIAPPTQTVEDASLSFGTQVVRQQGAAGKRSITFQIVLTNGKETGRTEIQNVVVQEPIPTVVARGKAISIPADKTTLMAAAGIASGDYPYVNYIISRESGWCPTKMQGQVGYCPSYAATSFPSGLGYGLCQSTPATKMASAGADWASNPVTQLKWCSGYAIGRYGSWAGAYNFWLSKHYW